MNTPGNASGQIHQENVCNKKEDRGTKAGSNGIHAMGMLEKEEDCIVMDILGKAKDCFSSHGELNKTEVNSFLLPYAKLTEEQLQAFISRMEPYFYSLDILPQLNCTEEKREIEKERLIVGMKNEVAKILLSQEAPVNLAMHAMRGAVTEIIKATEKIEVIKKEREKQIKTLEKGITELLKANGIAAQHVENFLEFNGDNVWAKQATIAMPGKDLSKAQNIVQAYLKDQGIQDLRLITHLFADNENVLVGCYIG